MTDLIKRVRHCMVDDPVHGKGVRGTFNYALAEEIAARLESQAARIAELEAWLKAGMERENLLMNEIEFLRSESKP